MTLLRLALRNLLGAGLRTWLNVFVLSLSFVLIIFSRGLIEGMNKQAEEAMIDAEIGAGHYQHPAYDPYDPLTLPDAHGPVPAPLAGLAAAGRAAPVLVVQGTIYAEGRLFTVQIKGIDPGQTALSIPASVLDTGADNPEIPVLIGERMAKTAGLASGDVFTIQWRDGRGTFDARDARVIRVMATTVQSIDSGQIWIPLARLQAMTGLEGQATFVVLNQGTPPPPAPGETAAAAPSATAVPGASVAGAGAVLDGWGFRSQADFLSDLRAMVRAKNIGSSFVTVIFLALAMLAIFDTQVLSIFRRRREMGTLMALGFTRAGVIGLFTLEGLLNTVLAALIGAIYGIPILGWVARTGWAMPPDVDSYGFAIGERLFPSYSLGLIAGTALVVLLTTAVVSFLPTRRIAKLKPTDALRGRMT